MAGVTDSSFRKLCMSLGASYCISEMVSAKALTMGDKKTERLLTFSEAERPFGIQLFGHEPEIIGQAAKIVAERYSPDFIDINMGCPTPKIVCSGAGSALMSTPETAVRAVECSVSSVNIPVTVKIRAGYHSQNCETLAPLLEKSGAAAITVHGRLADDMYRPPVRLDAIAAVKRSVSIPVIGNGDVKSLDDAEEMKRVTGCDGVMIGRASYGNPFVFSRSEQYRNPDMQTKMQVLIRQAEDACNAKGEYIAIHELRKHAAWYIKGFRGAATFRDRALRLDSLDELKRFADEVLECCSSNDS